MSTLGRIKNLGIAPLLIVSASCMLLFIAAFVASAQWLKPQVVEISAGQMRAEVSSGSRWLLAHRVAHPDDRVATSTPIPEASLNGNPIVFDAEYRHMISTPSAVWKSFASAKMPEDGLLEVDAEGLPDSVVLLKSQLMQALLVVGIATLFGASSMLFLFLGARKAWQKLT